MLQILSRLDSAFICSHSGTAELPCAWALQHSPPLRGQARRWCAVSDCVTGQGAEEEAGCSTGFSFHPELTLAAL